jgi:hypothetical protein
MADFLVSPSRPTEWRLDTEEFELRLRAASPHAQIWRTDDPASLAVLRFNVVFTEEQELDGWLMRDGQVVELNGGLEEGAVIAAWIRTIAPVDQELIFWDEGYHFAVPLVPGMDHREIVDAALV